MVRLLILVCSLHSPGVACHRVDPMYAAMPLLVCNMRQTQLAEAWAEQNPELIVGGRGWVVWEAT